MTPEILDHYFPFFVFAYGVLVSFALGNDKMMKMAESRMPAEIVAQFRSRRILALVCLVVGGVWTLQNLWFN